MIFLNNDNLEDFLERYARHSTEEGWGGLSDSIFMADLLNIKICILDKTSKVMHEFNPTFPNENTIVAFLLAEPNHYRAMIPKLAKPISTTTQTKCNYTYHKINKQTHLVNTPPITSPTPLPMPPLTIKMTIDKQTEFHHSTQKQNHKQLNILGINIQSLDNDNRFNAIETRLKEYNSNPLTKVHILAINETWCKNPKQLITRK
jgi:hypothetical protein